MTTREIENPLLQDGWVYKNTRGSRKHFIHPSKPGKATVPRHKGDLDIKTANSILKQAGLR